MSILYNDKNKNKPMHRDDAKKVFYNALEYMEAAKKLRFHEYKYKGETGNCVLVYCVNLVFSIELFLKCILIYENNFKKGHNLYEMFNMIGDLEIKKSIKQKCGIIEGLEFDDQLNDIGDAYEYLRYEYERIEPRFNLGFAQLLLESIFIESEKLVSNLPEPQ